jgi:hypothetical protein
MIDVILKVYRHNDKECVKGEIKINPTYTIKDIKNAILKDLEIDNPDMYYVMIIPKNEDVKFSDSFGNGCTLEIRKALRWVSTEKLEIDEKVEEKTT